MKKYAFISFPMAGLSHETVALLFDRYARYVESEGYIALQSLIRDDFPASKYYAAQSLHMLLTHASVLFIAPGWGESRGCRLEETAAREYEIPIENLPKYT